MCKRKRMTVPTVNVEGNETVLEPNNEPREAVNVEGNESVLEPGQEDREAVNEVDGAHSDDSFQAAICSEDEELNEIRQCNKEILSQEMGNIVLNSGAVLGEGVDASNSIQFNTVRPSRVVNANVPTSPHEGMHSRADNTIDEPGPSTTEPQQQSWSDFCTNYDGGYESYPRSSGDEGPIMASDEDETLVQS
ncbi:uncharacterized protein LOC109833012 [Asparagus officinalis]|uniref:uncharacterized protein LOC109833012 n=1 Tax=Asparagus officinalis TaxID=4686 RepID=UPI00098DF2BA|nr:uncharacterized protein LOC109833012 [Asparagus officinalis]